MSGRTIQGALSSANTEQVQDIVGGMFQNAAGITWTYNDAAGTITPATDHGGIGGLADDDHTQYALLAGRAGGQTLTGGTAATQTLRLEGTSHATPGYVYTLNSNFGVGIAAPATATHVYSTAAAYSTIQRDSSGSNMEIGGVRFSGGAANTTRAAIYGYTPSSDSSGALAFLTQINSGALTEAGRFNDLQYLGIGTGTTVDRRLHVEQDSATTSAVTYVGRFTSTSSGAPANGIGVGIEFEVATAAGNNEVGATIEAVTVDTTPTSEDFKFVFKTMVAGAAATTSAELETRGLKIGNPIATTAWNSGTNYLDLGDKLSLYGQTVNEHAGLTYNAYYNSIGNWVYKTSGDIAVVQDGRDAGYALYTAAAGTAGTNIIFSLEATFGPNGIVVGSPTGGSKGLGTINAQAVYDDNVLLTCYVFDQTLDGIISMPKWDAKVPAQEIRGISGKIVSTTVRQHDFARKFASRIGSMYDPLDLDKYWQHIIDKRHLTSLPNEAAYDPINGKLDIGSWLQRLIEAVEIQAVHIHKLNTRLKALENSGITTTVVT